MYRLIAEAPPAPQSTPEPDRSSSAWPAICNLELQINYLLRKLDELEARIHEANSERAIWLPNVFLSLDGQTELGDLHGRMQGNATAASGAINDQGWKGAVGGVLEKFM